MFSGSKKSMNPKECLCTIILGAKTFVGHLVFFCIDIGCRDAWQPPCLFA